MNNELSKFGRSPIRVATVPKQELGQIRKLGDGKIGSERRLLSFFANNANA